MGLWIASVRVHIKHLQPLTWLPHKTRVAPRIPHNQSIGPLVSEPHNPPDQRLRSQKSPPHLTRRLLSSADPGPDPRSCPVAPRPCLPRPRARVPTEQRSGSQHRVEKKKKSHSSLGFTVYKQQRKLLRQQLLAAEFRQNQMQWNKEHARGLKLRQLYYKYLDFARDFQQPARIIRLDKSLSTPLHRSYSVFFFFVDKYSFSPQIPEATMLSCYMVGGGSARTEVVQTDMNSMSPNGKTRSRGEGVRLARILESICELEVGREGQT